MSDVNQRDCVVDADDDPVLLAFLDLLEREIESHPERLVPVSARVDGADAGGVGRRVGRCRRADRGRRFPVSA